MDPLEQARALGRAAAAGGDATGWFEQLYAQSPEVPWDLHGPHPALVEWAAGRSGAGRRALVVGCGYGDDAEFVAGLGFGTVAFDVAPSAVAGARARFPDSAVDYVVGDALDPAPEWRAAFDLVVESRTVQSLPDPYRRQAIDGITGTVGPGGTLLVIAAGLAGSESVTGPPWPLTTAELDLFTATGLRRTGFTETPGVGELGVFRWVVEFTRP